MNIKLLTIILILAVFLAPLKMQAETAAQLAVTISSFTGGGTGSLSATKSNDTVYVTGTLNNVTTRLKLDIDAGVTVMWQAEISTDSGFTGYALIYSTGSGTFNVATGGYVMSTKNGVYAVSSFSTHIIVNGTGKVEATGDATIAINAYGRKIEIKDDAQVIAISGIAIMAGYETIVTVSGGTVSSITGFAILAVGEKSIITVCGTGKVQVTGNESTAIATPGKVVVSGGEVNATDGNAIFVNNENSTVTVSGTGRVQATGTGSAITTSGNVELSGGEVNAAKGYAIFTDGVNSTVTVSGVIKMAK